MENKNLTAVEWLIEFIQDHCIRIDEKVIEQANQLFKEQIAEAYEIGVEDSVHNNPLKTGNEYYRETYNK